MRCIRTSSSLLNRSSERSPHAPCQSVNHEQTFIKVCVERQKTTTRTCQETTAHRLRLRLASATVIFFASPAICLALESISCHNGSFDRAIVSCRVAWQFEDAHRRWHHPLCEQSTRVRSSTVLVVELSVHRRVLQRRVPSAGEDIPSNARQEVPLRAIVTQHLLV